MRKVNIDALALLPIANDLGYIIECLAVDYTGEAKSELRALIGKTDDYEHPMVQGLLQEHRGVFEKALELIYERRLHEAAGLLNNVSREVWQHILF
jgi:hypothetical protein